MRSPEFLSAEQPGIFIFMGDKKWILRNQCFECNLGVTFETFCLKMAAPFFAVMAYRVLH